MWSQYSLTLVGLVLAIYSCWSINTEASIITTNHIDDGTDEQFADNIKDDELAEGRGGSRLRRIIPALMIGVILKVASMVPMKLMVLTFFALISLFTSKMALILAAITGLLQRKSNNNHHDFTKRITEFVPIYHEKFEPYGSYSGGQFSSFSSGGDLNNYDTQSSSLYGTDTAESSIEPIITAHNRAQVQMYG